MSKILKTNINKISWISGEYDTLEHPFNGIDSFEDIRQMMNEYEQEFPDFKNLRFEARSEYVKSPGHQYAVTSEWYDLVGDYKSKLMEALE